MGEVYRARDTRLGRDVAIKVSTERLSERMEREARTIAALNHPHIATLYDVGEHEGSLYLAMEFVKGAPLKGPCEVKEAIGYGIQIAEGLAAAHEAGVVHRDLKPGNILVTEKGSVKILDFGLAKLAEKNLNGATAATQTMAIAGTPGYLAPEQLHGKPADTRSDIFAFGCILYELVGGQRAFPGETLAASLASTAMMEPKPLEGVPWALEELIGRCLRKDPERRLQHIADARVMLEDIRDGGQTGSGRRPQEPAASPAQLRRGALGWVAAALLGLALAALAAVHFREKPAALPAARFAVEPPPKTVFTTTANGPSPALVSPDGQRIVFSATSADGNSQLWVRSLDALPAQPLPGTEGAAAAFWSPDSRAIVYSTGGKLRKVDLAGGRPLTLADSPGLRGGSWSPAGIIVFAPDSTSALLRVAAGGGAPVPATKLDAARGENSHRFPWFLPDGRHFLFGAGRANPGPVLDASAGGGDPEAIRIGSLDSLDSKVLLEADSNAIYSQGYLLFLRERTLMAQPFDAKRLALTGEAVPLAEEVPHMFATKSSWYGLFSASETGLLAYQTGLGSGNLLLTWMDPNGKRLATAGDPTNLGRIQISPDQKSAAVAVTEGNNTDIWIYDLAHNLRTRFTFDPAVEREAVWSPDGRSIVFSSNRKGHFDLYRKASDETGVEELLYSDGLDKYPTSWSPDGKFLLYWACCDPKNGFHSWVLPLTAGAKPFALLETPINEWNPQFSPDERWVAYQSTESGRGEIYVVPFGPEGGATGGKRQVSTAGGVLSRWRRDGKELFYIAPGGKLMAAEVESKGGSFATGQVKALFGPLRVQGYFYDVSADGQRFLAVVPSEQTTAAEPITVVLNWTAGLKK
jgi:Tol biopolymer transport system component